MRPRFPSGETFIDYAEPDDNGYVPLDVAVVRPSVDEELLALDRDDLGVSDGLALTFTEFVDAENNLPLNLPARFVAKFAQERRHRMRSQTTG